MSITNDLSLPVDLVDTEVSTIAELARVAAEPIALDPDVDYAIVDADGKVHIEHTAIEPLRYDRINTTRRLENLDSLIAFVDKHANSTGSEVFASKIDATITAVIDGAEGNDFLASEDRFGKESFRGTLTLHTTRPWQDWTAISGKLFDQQEFAEFIEDHVDDIVAPAAGDVLEVAQSLQASTGVEFSSSRRLDNGETQIGYSETIKAKAGQRGELVIPKELTLALQPFEGVTELAGKQTKVAVTARFRYRLRDGQLRLGVKLIGIDRILDLLWDQIVAELKARTTVAVFVGRP